MVHREGEGGAGPGLRVDRTDRAVRRGDPGAGHEPAHRIPPEGDDEGRIEDLELALQVRSAGRDLVRLLGSLGWQREDVFITNVVKCRPPDNRDPQPDEIAACAPYLRRQLAVLDPAVVVTLGRYSMGTFIPGSRISQAHGTVHPVDPETGAATALAFAMYHPAAALRSPGVERDSFEDMARLPTVLLRARAMRGGSADERTSGEHRATAASDVPGDATMDDAGPHPVAAGTTHVETANPADPEPPATPALAAADPAADEASQLTLF
jgi:DNA polymerase